MASPTIKDHVAGIANRIATRPSDAQIDRRLESLSRWMDSQFRIPFIGWRFGLNPIIDLIPVVGAVATTLVAIYVMISGIRYRVSRITLLRMALNIAIYFLVGLIPWVGNLFDAWWKPNIRNIALLRARATVHGAEAAHGRTSDWMFVGAIVCALLTLLFVSVVLTFMALAIVIRTILAVPVQ